MKSSFGMAAVGVLAVVCCVGLPLLVAAGLSAAAFAWIGALALVPLTLVVAVLAVRVRRGTRG